MALMDITSVHLDRFENFLESVPGQKGDGLSDDNIKKISQKVAALAKGKGLCRPCVATCACTLTNDRPRASRQRPPPYTLSGSLPPSRY